MNKNRRLSRVLLVMLLIFLLPLGGFLYAFPSHQIYAYCLALICFVLAICIEYISQLTEREAMISQLKLREDKSELDEWKEKVRELDRIVASIAQENQEYRREVLDHAIHSVATRADPI